MMLSNSVGLVRRPTTRTGIGMPALSLRRAAELPAGISTFCSTSAFTTSVAVNRERPAAPGQATRALRLALAEDHHIATPGTRFSASFTYTSR